LVCKDIEKGKRCLDAQDLKYQQVAETLRLNVQSSMEALPIIDRCREHLVGFEVTKGTMDDVFLAVTGKEIRE
jgi:multidrug/hemolysin transport system ATP-binding protein